MSEIILPGTSLKGAEEYTQTDFKADILADKIKSTFLKTNTKLEAPLVCIDLSNTNETLMIALDALKKFILTDEYIQELKENMDKLPNLVNVYMVATKSMIKIGFVTERVAYKVLPSFVKDVFPPKTGLYLSETGENFKDMQKNVTSKIKLVFED